MDLRSEEIYELAVSLERHRNNRQKMTFKIWQHYEKT